jgi:2-polyprenyl-3-methyl-5-hydroxy-6-metoxy-1,4-benzoquinol methylase
MKSLNKLAQNIYGRLVGALKACDQRMNYRLCGVVRALTNLNTRRYWDRYFTHYENFYRDFPYKFMADFLPQDVPFSLLDIGCAIGDGCEFLKKQFPKAEIFGADFSALAVQKAGQKSADIRYFLLDILKEAPPRSYDFIILSHILEHINDPFSVVDKCLKFVKKALLVSTPYTKDITIPRLYAPSEHRYLFNEHTFEKYNAKVLAITPLIEDTGYQNIIYEIRCR